jgi:acyl-CoA synthetase (NDP forming)
MSLTALLKPRSIAIVGASATPTRVGGIPLNLLIEAGFKKIFPINPKNQEIAGLTCYPDIESLPEVVDVVLLAISADDTLPYLERCHARGVKAAVVFAAGFAETQEAEGIARQAALKAFADRTGMRLAGPNCMGNANFVDGVFTTFGTSFRPGDPAGRTALLTQSGNMCATVYRMARRVGVAFSHVINTGNEADVEFSDYLQFLADDADTDSVLCYVEALRDGASFLKAAAAFRAKGKLLALYKVGASEKGADAARSHTAALAGNNKAYEAAFSLAGIAHAEDLATLTDLAYLHRFGKRIRGNACAIVSVSGAGGAILADALALRNADVPEFPADVQAQLRDRIPAYGMVSNPVDVTGNLVNNNDFLFDAMKLAVDPKNVDVIIAFLPGYFLDRAVPQLERLAQSTDKGIVVVDTFATGNRAAVEAAGIAYFDDFDRAARAVALYGAWTTHVVADAPRNVLADGAPIHWPALPSGSGALSEIAGKQALAAFGVPVVEDVVVQSSNEACAAAQRLGYPLVLKLVSPDVAHKTEYGVIKLGLSNESAVFDAYEDVLAKAKALPNVRIDGITLEPMLPGGVELLVGVTRDAVFGWMLTVGLGGVWTELMQDVSHRLLPVDESGALDMLKSLKGFPLLDGFRGKPKADIAAAAKAIAALSTATLAADGRVREIEINPLLVLPAGQGAVAVDALVMFDAPTEPAR